MTDMPNRPSSGRDWLTMGEAAAIAHVSRQAMDVWILRHRLDVHIADDGWRIEAEVLAAFLAVRRAAAETGVHVQTMRRWIEEART